MRNLKASIEYLAKFHRKAGAGAVLDDVAIALASRERDDHGLRFRSWSGPIVSVVAFVAVLGVGAVALLFTSRGEEPGFGFGAQSTEHTVAVPSSVTAPPTTIPPAASTTEAAPTTTEAPPTTVAAAINTGVEFHEVTMELLGDEGLATTCGVLIMRSGDGMFPASTLLADGTSGSSVPRLFLSIPEELSWQRDFPEPVSGEGFGVSPSNQECHGGTVEGSPASWDGLFWFTQDDDVIEVGWHFDYYKVDSVDTEGAHVGVLENFTIKGEAPVEWTESPDGERVTEVSGEFSIAWYQNLDGELVHLYEPFAGSPRPFHFRLTVSPALDSIVVEERVELDEITAAAAYSAAAWNAVAEELGVENLTLENGTSSSETSDSDVDTIWELSTETVSARVKHVTWSGNFEMLFFLDSGYDTEAGQALLHDATRVMIRVWEPTLSDLEMEDLANRLLAPEEYGYAEIGHTLFISDTTSETERYVLATPMA